MKTTFRKTADYGLITLLALAIGFSACKKDKGPVVTLAELSTTEVTGLTKDDAKGGGNITQTGGALSHIGIVWSSTNMTPTVDANQHEGKTDKLDGVVGQFDTSFTNLMVDKTYYVRAYATNAAGTAYGEVKTFVIDASTNLYHTVKIGTQVWMRENLKTIKYNDGLYIPPVTDGVSWSGLSSPAYCWYNNDAATKSIYGVLYNLYVVGTGKLAPTGWRVPNDTDWETLATNLGGMNLAGKKLKEEGFAHWLVSQTFGTNESGFTALPAGNRILPSGNFQKIGEGGFWWSSTNSNLFTVNSGGDELTKDMFNEKVGLSVRCIKE